MTTNVIVNPQRIIGTVDPLIYGSFVENLGRCMYGGVYDPDSPVADAEGFRQDVIQGAKQMGVSCVRYPGGCFAPYYHFADGLGPKAERPYKRYAAYPPQNDFGTEEYLSWCRKTGSEPYICVNMGTGTAEEAMQWVEYCNGRLGSVWADKRAENGHPEPHHVKLWALGNEISAPWELGYTVTPEAYIDRAWQYAHAMKAADPDIRLVIAGAHFPIGFPHDDWNRKVLDALFDVADYISIHNYIGHDYEHSLWDKWQQMTPEQIHNHLQEYMRLLEDAIAMMREDIRYICHKHHSHKPIYIALDEYNPWYREEKDCFVPFDLKDGLLVGAYFNLFLRNSDVLKLCCMAQLVNTIPALVCESGTARFYRQSPSYVQELFAMCKGMNAVDVWGDFPMRPGSYYSEVPLLDVSAAAEPRRVVLMLLNRDTEQTLSVQPHVVDAASLCCESVTLFHADDLEVRNTFEHQKALVPIDAPQLLTEGVLCLPPHSLTRCVLTW